MTTAFKRPAASPARAPSALQRMTPEDRAIRLIEEIERSPREVGPVVLSEVYQHDRRARRRQAVDDAFQRLVREIGARNVRFVVIGVAGANYFADLFCERVTRASRQASPCGPAASR